jgi:hypothetical protein
MFILSFMFFLALSCIVIPISLIVVFLVANRSIAFGLAFWSSLIAAHVSRFLITLAIADMFFTGLTGPGIGPSLDVLCLPPVSSEFELECSKLSSITHRNVVVTAFFSLILFMLDVVRTNMRTRNVIAA